LTECGLPLAPASEQNLGRPRAGNIATAAVVAALLTPGIAGGEERKATFDADPGWDGFQHQLVPVPSRKTRQDFGYRPSRFAGGRRAGEVGGWVQRSSTPAWYAKVIAPRTLDDRLKRLREIRRAAR
jgi:hypothetical protein